MGTTITSTGSTQQSSSSSQATPTPEETAYNQQLLKEQQESYPYRSQAMIQGYGLVNQLLTGKDLPGNLSQISKGISAEDIGMESAETARMLLPQYQQMGILNSGSAYKSLGRQIANQVNMPAKQFNLGQQMQALNLASGQAAQVVGQTGAQSQQLSQAFAGLRSQTSSSTGVGSGFQSNPYQGVNLGILGTWGGNYCWVAAEIFGGWDEPKTVAARYYIGFMAPKWFKTLYQKYGERLAAYIHDKGWAKAILRPMFEMFAYKGMKALERSIYAC